MDSIISRLAGGFRKTMGDWRVALFVSLCLIGSIACTMHMISTGFSIDELIPIILWVVLLLIMLKFKAKAFPALMYLMCIFVILTNEASNISISAFLLVLFVLIKKRKCRVLCTISLTIIYITKYSIRGISMVYIISFMLQIMFVVFAYNAFLHNPLSKDPSSKIICSEKEREVLDMIVLGDLARKEVAYRLNLNIADLSRMLTSIKEKNGYNTNDRMLFVYAVQRCNEMNDWKERK